MRNTKGPDFLGAPPGSCWMEKTVIFEDTNIDLNCYFGRFLQLLFPFVLRFFVLFLMPLWSSWSVLYVIWRKSSSHLFHGCIYSRVLWREGPWNLNFDAFVQASFTNWVKFISNSSNLPYHARANWVDLMLYTVLLFDTIWFTRNKVFRDNFEPDV